MKSRKRGPAPPVVCGPLATLRGLRLTFCSSRRSDLFTPPATRRAPRPPQARPSPGSARGIPRPRPSPRVAVGIGSRNARLPGICTRTMFRGVTFSRTTPSDLLDIRLGANVKAKAFYGIKRAIDSSIKSESVFFCFQFRGPLRY
jgi:hypothetical protein